MTSTPAMTAEPASLATSCATRVTRAIGAGTRDERLPADLLFVGELDFAVAALREDELPAALRFFVELPARDVDALRPLDALRALDAPEAADRRELVFFDFFLPALFDEAPLPDFPRDFFALVAIDASPRSR
jgi:hypothetical protein